MDQINTLMASANANKNGQTLGNSKLQFSSYDGYADVLADVSLITEQTSKQKVYIYHTRTRS